MSEKLWRHWGFFWRHDTEDDSDGMGDLSFNSDDRDIRIENTSSWAYTAIEERMWLLQERKRWPDELNKHPSVVCCWAVRMITRPINKIFGTHLPYRAQGRMTRDSYTAWATNCIRLGRGTLIYGVTIPWYIRTPSFMAWWNYVRTNEIKYLERYRFWRSIWFKSKKDYVIRLNVIREKGIAYLNVNPNIDN